MNYLNICDIHNAPVDYPSPDELVHTYQYPLDPFQKHAVAAIHRGENVFVTAKTGSGKTLVGEYQIYHSLARGGREHVIKYDNMQAQPPVKTGGRVFYTTPIKSLSNQKFNDLSRLFPSVGIMTGDIKYRPDAQVVVMTTEILRNLLYKRGTATEKLGLTADMSLDGLDAVIFDEVHYINNHERGKVWEETMILLPRDIRLILLSATLAQPEIFGAWLGRLKQVPVNLISTQYRVVPLTHSLVFWKGDTPQLKTLMDSKEVYYDKVYLDWLKELKQQDKDVMKFKEAVATKNALDYANRENEEHVKAPVALGKPRLVAHIHRVNRLVEYMKSEGLLPCLMFIFSRRKCEEYAQQIDVDLLDWCETSEVASIFKNYMASRPDIRDLTQTQELEKLLLKGVAYHHSGLLPVLKEVVEILFGKGLIKVMFCTETFAVGINMPTKSAVFLGYEKYSDEKECRRVLYTDEYMQMAGRAGRRGLDKVGHVLHLPMTGDRDLITAEQMKCMVKSSMPCVKSRMDFSYEFILKALNAGGDLWRNIIQNSYWAEQQKATVAQIGREIELTRKKLIEFGFTEQFLKQLREGWDLQENMHSSKQAKQAFDRWRQAKIGPVWDTAWKKMKDYVALERQIVKLTADATELGQCLANPAKMLESRIMVLGNLGFIEEAVGMPILTKKGQMASEINEGSPLLMTELYLSGALRGHPWNVIAAALGGFLGDTLNCESSACSAAIKSAIKEIREREEEFGVCSSDSAWIFDTKWVNIFEDYYGVVEDPLPIDIICSKYDMYAGDFMKALTKSETLIEEWKTLCTMDENVADLEELTKFNRLTETDSIYLREAVIAQNKLAKNADSL